MCVSPGRGAGGALGLLCPCYWRLTQGVPQGEEGRGAAERRMGAEGQGGGAANLRAVRVRGREAPDASILHASHRRRPNPGLRSGSPPCDRGSRCTPRLPPPREHGDRQTHPNRTEHQSCRGLSQPLGIHLDFALGLSNEVGPPHGPALSTYHRGPAPSHSTSEGGRKENGDQGPIADRLSKRRRFTLFRTAVWR